MMKFEESLDEKLKELAEKHEIPLELLRETIELEKKKVVLLNRRLGPKIAEIVADYTPEEVSQRGGN